ncbi:two-component system response regulator, partial [Pseudoalteromonas sp. S4491]
MVLHTGIASIARAEEEIRLGADDYLTKPVEFNSLLKT